MMLLTLLPTAAARVCIVVPGSRYTHTHTHTHTRQTIFDITLVSAFFRLKTISLRGACLVARDGPRQWVG